MVEDFLELGGGFASLTRGQKGFSPNINRVQSGPPVITGFSEFVRRGGCKNLDSTGSIPLVECKLRAKGWKEVGYSVIVDSGNLLAKSAVSACARLSSPTYAKASAALNCTPWSVERCIAEAAPR